MTRLNYCMTRKKFDVLLFLGSKGTLDNGSPDDIVSNTVVNDRPVQCTDITAPSG